MNKQKKTTLILYGALGLLVLAALAFLLRPKGTGGTVAQIQVEDRVIMEIPLDTTADGTFSIADKTGLPITFRIEDHAIRFLDSDCPDKICVKAGFLHRDMDIASCLPNKTILIISAPEEEK